MKYQYFSLIVRNILRNKKQSVLILLCTIIASYIIFAQMAQSNSVAFNLRQVISEAISGQLVIYDSDKKINALESQFSDLRRYEWDIQEDSNLKNSVSGIENIAPRLRFGGLLIYEDETMGLNFQALEKEHILRIGNIIELTQGEIPNSNDELMISEVIADVLNVQTGDSVIILTNNANGYLSDGILVISGIFSKAGLGQFLIPTGYMLYSKGQYVLGVEENNRSEVIVNFTDFTNENRNTKELNSFLQKEKPKLKLASWKDTIPLLKSIVDIWKGFGYIIQTIFIAFSFLILVNIIIMITNHRKKEFGTLLAMGFKPRWIINTVAWEYVIISVSAVLITGFLLKIVFALFFRNGMYIPWEAMQVAYLSTHIKPIIYISNIVFIALIFGATSYLAVQFSLRNLSKTEIVSLLATNT